MQDKFIKLIFFLLIFFILVNVGTEVVNATYTPLEISSLAPNIDGNCYYTKNQITSFFNNLNIRIVDIVKYSSNNECVGKAIGSNLIPGENLNDIQNVFITTNTSYKTIYFSYPIVSSIFFLILILFFIFDYKEKLIVIFILFCTLLNINSFSISSHRHNNQTNRVIQFSEFNFENYRVYTNPNHFIKNMDIND
tara:strand:- start:791 stop:1372 length:582 start_codon:yes stop_codon:yes gene_type:complete